MPQLLFWIICLYAVYAILKPLFFIVIGYDCRRRLLDSSYFEKRSATGRSDVALYALCLFITVALYCTGVDHRSFLAGLLVGMTIIQLFFHRFSAPLAVERAAPHPDSPIKTMSYAIQDNPLRAWKELLLIAVLPLLSLLALLV